MNGLADKLIDWFGGYHPPAAYVPVAFLAGAGIMQMLWLIRRTPLYESAARFSLWIGTLGAAPVALLGWCLAGFGWTDPSWVLTTHRWLGSSVAAAALIVLVLAERSRRDPGKRSIRIAFTIGLVLLIALILAQVFLGRAMVYGFP